ncbi:MAG: transglycosylase family protein [Thermoleophilia bacterium]|nr:transglycosylase family protein [Thermoleophilia bacterium]
MKTILSLAVALAAIPAGAALLAPSPAESAEPTPPELVAAIAPDAPPLMDAAALRSRIDRLSARARTHSTRLGLRSAPGGAHADPPAGGLAAREHRLTQIVAFLAQRREVDLAVDERPAVARGRAGAPLERRYAAVVRHATRLGIDRPARPRPAATPEGRAAQIARWTAIARWLGDRTERLRADERPLSERVPNYDAWMCIAEHESHRTWDISTGNGYYGGLQMDRQFQQTYDPGLYRTKGTADNWTAEEQMRTAERARATRGFHPWPNTARMCGLL